jgi:hypothetical protein
MAFEWNRMHKWEENIENRIIEETHEYVKEYYSVDDIMDLTAEQVAEIETFAESDYVQHSLMYRGICHIIDEHENNTEDQS